MSKKAFTTLLALVALLPLSTSIRPLDVSLDVFGSQVRWVKSVFVQLLEFRLYPVVACTLLLSTAIGLARAHTAGPALSRTLQPFCWGLGLLTFSLLKYTLFVAFAATPLWADFWEELTELLGVAGVALVLWVFRRPLGLDRRPSDIDRQPGTPHQEAAGQP